MKISILAFNNSIISFLLIYKTKMILLNNIINNQWIIVNL